MLGWENYLKEEILEKTMFRKLALILKSRSVRLPLPTRWPSIRLPKMVSMPSLSLGKGKVKYVLLSSVVVSGLVVGVGLYFAVYDIAKATFEWPRAGAQYAALHDGHTIGQPLPPNQDGTDSQTLQVYLADGARLSTLKLQGMDLGKTGLVECFQIGRDTTNTTGHLYVENLTMSGVSAPSFDMAHTDVNVLELGAYVDGHTNSATLDSTISDQVVSSDRGSGEFLAENSVVDRVLITLMGTATIRNLTLSDVACSVGAFDIDYVKAGHIVVDNASKFGDGDGIDSADFIIQQTVKARSHTDNLVDTPITVR